MERCLFRTSHPCCREAWQCGGARLRVRGPFDNAVAFEEGICYFSRTFSLKNRGHHSLPREAFVWLPKRFYFILHPIAWHLCAAALRAVCRNIFARIFNLGATLEWFRTDRRSMWGNGECRKTRPTEPGCETVCALLLIWQIPNLILNLESILIPISHALRQQTIIAHIPAAFGI